LSQRCFNAIIVASRSVKIKVEIVLDITISNIVLLLGIFEILCIKKCIQNC